MYWQQFNRLHSTRRALDKILKYHQNRDPWQSKATSVLSGFQWRSIT